MISSDEIRAAKRLLAEDRRDRAAKRTKPEKKPVVRNGEKRTRVRDLAFLSWLHESIPCIACMIEGAPKDHEFGTWHPKRPWLVIEAAHQKHVGGKGGMLGKRPDDADSCPLCAWHHRLAPNACDPAQRKFWARLGVDVAAYCKALHAAFKNGEPGAAVARHFAGTAS